MFWIKVSFKSLILKFVGDFWGPQKGILITVWTVAVVYPGFVTSSHWKQKRLAQLKVSKPQELYRDRCQFSKRSLFAGHVPNRSVNCPLGRGCNQVYFARILGRRSESSIYWRKVSVAFQLSVYTFASILECMYPNPWTYFSIYDYF